MIRLTRTAREQIADLSSYYEDLERSEAVRNLGAVLSRAAHRIVSASGSFYPATRPYPELARAGWLWLKGGSYWIAFTISPDGATIQVLFHEAADIPGRI